MSEDELARLELIGLALPAEDRETVLRAAAEIRRYRAALVEGFAARLYYGDLSPGWQVWEFLPREKRADYRQQARDRLNGDSVVWLASQVEENV
jgi:hypothetical protein